MRRADVETGNFSDNHRKAGLCPRPKKVARD
jgi:hypothetical protein